MPIPVFEDIKLPAPNYFADGQIHSAREAGAALAAVFNLTEEERRELLPSGAQTRWDNRVSWSCSDLYRAGLLQRPRRGHYQITPPGLQVLADNPASLHREYLETRFPAFKEWNRKPRAGAQAEGKAKTRNETPPAQQTATERIDAAFEEIQNALKQDLLDQVRSMNPFKFEKLVIDLLVAMGYGGSRAEAVRVTQRSNDGGIDGVINEDRLGLDVIYIQAKRWQNAVGRVELQSFVGALAGQGAGKGVFITSGQFSGTAREYVKSISQKVILIDGDRLAGLMIEHGVGVSVEDTYIVKRIDGDYFENT